MLCRTHVDDGGSTSSTVGLVCRRWSSSLGRITVMEDGERVADPWSPAPWLAGCSGSVERTGVTIWVRSAARIGLRAARFTSVGSPMTASATYSR